MKEKTNEINGNKKKSPRNIEKKIKTEISQTTDEIGNKVLKLFINYYYFYYMNYYSNISILL